MPVQRVVPDLGCTDPSALSAFYSALLGMEVVMDQGWIATVQAPRPGPVQISFAREGGSGTPVPALSIEVDDLAATLAAAQTLGAEIVYGPVNEPWGVRRFFLRDPDGNLINILSHSD